MIRYSCRYLVRCRQIVRFWAEYRRGEFTCQHRVHCRYLLFSPVIERHISDKLIVIVVILENYN